jgi:hypothetical protein
VLGEKRYVRVERSEEQASLEIQIQLQVNGTTTFMGHVLTIAFQEHPSGWPVISSFSRSIILHGKSLTNLYTAAPFSNDLS